MKTLKLNDTKRRVLLDALQAVGWGAMAANHPDRKAAEALMAELKPEQAGITLDMERRLYNIPCNDGHTCLGFDVAQKWAIDVLIWLKSELQPLPALHAMNAGTVKGYNEYRDVMDAAGGYALRANKKCPAQLTEQLIGLEGKRVEVVDHDGETRTFKVGRSTGWLPVHLEVDRQGDGGPAADSRGYRSVVELGETNEN